MIRWEDEGLIIGYRLHGETSAILELMTNAHGRHFGIVRGGASRKQAPHLQPGQLVSAVWSARLEDHLGTYAVQPQKSYLSALMTAPLALAGFQAMTSLLRFSLAERDPHPRLFQSVLTWLEHARLDDDILHTYLDFEILLLREAGFRLELRQCVVSGAREGLAYISPRTGHAVTKDAAGEYADRLLPYSKSFHSEGSLEDIVEALSVTEYFLTHWLASQLSKAALPDARGRFIDQLQKSVRKNR